MAPLMVFRGAGLYAPEKQMKIKLKYMKAKEMHIKMIWFQTMLQTNGKNFLVKNLIKN